MGTQNMAPKIAVGMNPVRTKNKQMNESWRIKKMFTRALLEPTTTLKFMDIGFVSLLVPFCGTGHYTHTHKIETYLRFQ
jgi:hypothetical protein